MGLVGPPASSPKARIKAWAGLHREESTSVPIWDPKDRSCFLLMLGGSLSASMVWWLKDTYSLGSKGQILLPVDVGRITVSVYGLVVKRHLLFGREAITNLDSILKSRHITLPTKV